MAANIDLSRKHNLDPVAARAKAEEVAVEMNKKFGIIYKWEGDTIKVNIPKGIAAGAKGGISITDKVIRVQIELPGLLGMFKGLVEGETKKHLDEVVGRK